MKMNKISNFLNWLWVQSEHSEDRSDIRAVLHLFESKVDSSPDNIIRVNSVLVFCRIPFTQ